MTEREAVDAIRKYAEANGCTFFEHTVGDIVFMEENSIYVRSGQDGHIVLYAHAAPVEIPSAVLSLDHVRQISCAFYPVRLSDQIADLPKLDSIVFYNISRPLELPDCLDRAPSLKQICLYDCYVKSIPYSLIRTGLPFYTEFTDKERGIFLDHVTLDEGDITLFSRPREVIEEFYRQQTVEVRECKVIFLGDGNSGKSSLIERIIADKFEEGSLPTDGVKVSSWDTTIDEEAFSLRILDFGGQEIMHSMHRCFLTAHTVYVVVCEIRNDADIDREAARWLENVRSFAPGCPVILALNKADLNDNVSVNERALREICPDLRCVLRTSAKWERERGVADLIYAVQIAVPDCIGWFRANGDMIGVKRELEQMREGYIDADQYRTICLRHHIEEPSLQMGLLDWFKDLGVAYYYTHEKRLDTLLEDLRVLDPAWLTNGIYRLILRTPTGGFLSHAEIKRLLAEKDPLSRSPDEWYTPRETDYILHVMRMFQISHEIAEGEEMIPMKMEKTPPELYDEFPKAGSLHLRWTAAYLPNNLIHRMMIRKVDELDRNCVWRTGGWFHRGIGGIDACDALAEMGEKSVDVYVRAERDARPYMQEFRALIRQILSELNIHGEEVLCCTIDGQEGQVPYEDVLQQYRDGRAEIYISGIRKYISPAKLLQEHYVRIEREGWQMNNYFYREVRAPTFIEGDGNTIDIHDPGTVSYLAEAVRRRERVDDGAAEQIRDALSETPDLPEEIRVAVREEKEPRTFWEKLRPYLGDAEKLTKILQAAGPALAVLLTRLAA